MAEARSVLLSSSASVADVAWQVGDRDVPHFIEQFERRVGVTPEGWRRGAR